MDINKPLVSIHCLVYNHEPYLRQCLDGFVMQKTNFAFEAIVHDDCSTDNSAAIIREYEKKYPDIIKPIYETENQWSKHDGSIDRIMGEAYSPFSKYIAICEGDDYWTDPYKLQKQVDFLEEHPDYSMCFHAVNIEVNGEIVRNDRRGKNKERCYGVKTIIEERGDFCATCSLVYRKQLGMEMPVFRQIAPIGDYPLQILLGLKGKVYYFPEIMGVYRFAHAGAWTSNDSKENHILLQKKKAEWMGALDEFTHKKYTSSINISILKSALERYSKGVFSDDEIKNIIKKHPVSLFHITSASRAFYVMIKCKFFYPKLYALLKNING